jgi:hypothetical protein
MKTPELQTSVEGHSLDAVVRVCGGCRHWKIAPDKRHIFGFAERLSKQIGRRVEIGYCHATCEIGTGPTADADWCEKWEANSNDDSATPVA